MTDANLQIKLDAKLLAQAREVSQDLGFDLQTAIRVFIKQLVRDGRLPFIPDTQKREHYSRRSVEALLKSYEQVKNGDVVIKTIEELQAMEK